MDCRITIPYWDWTVNPRSPYTNPLFDNTLGLGNSVGLHNCINSGPLYAHKYHLTPSAGSGCLKRNYHTGFYPSRYIIERDILSKSAQHFSYFHQMLQLFISVNVQCFLGGTSCSVNAANEPAFINHLAFIDSIFSRWQAQGEGRTTVRYANDHKLLVLSGGLTVSQFSNNHKLPGGVSICYSSSGYTHSSRPYLLTDNGITTAEFSCRMEDISGLVTLDEASKALLHKECSKTGRLYPN